MFYSPREVECQLTMYPYSQKKLRHLEYLNHGNRLTDCQREELVFYTYIVGQVEQWVISLSPDERDIIRYRCFENMKFDYISVLLRYSNHSSVIRKYYKIIDQISYSTRQ